MEENPNIIKVNTVVGMGLSQYDSDPKSNTPLEVKDIDLDLPKYKIHISSSYSGVGEPLDDDYLVKIAEGYLPKKILQLALMPLQFMRKNEYLPSDF